MALTPIQINGGLAYDHTSVRVGILDGELFKSHLKSINFNDDLTPSENSGTHPIPLATGLGSYKATGSMTVVKEAWDDLLSRLPSGFGALVFPINITYIPRGSFQPSTVDLVDCRITGVKDSSSQGQGTLEVELTLYVRYILRNGICLVPIDADITPTLAA
jgi:hypothetical protein